MEKEVSEATVEIKNEAGLHMRPSMQFVDIANKYGCNITVSNGKDVVDGKSIMQMAMLAAACGTKLQIKAKGVGAKVAVSALRELVEDRHFDCGWGRRNGMVAESNVYSSLRSIQRPCVGFSIVPATYLVVWIAARGGYTSHGRTFAKGLFC